MASLTLKGLPDDLLDQLRTLAEQERRSLNQQVILLLEQALQQRRPGFAEVYEDFRQAHGASPLAESDLTDLRSPDSGRPVVL